MTNRERLKRVLRFEPVDRLPIIEWAYWWDKTLDRWRKEGLPAHLTDSAAIRDYFELDSVRQYWMAPSRPESPCHSGEDAPLVRNRDDYLALKDRLYPKQIFDSTKLEGIAQRHESGELIVWITLEGFFWYPRTLFGIEPHMYAFYDQPELMKEINQDLLEFNLRALDEFCSVCVPDFMSFAEDMSYNHGPMLSKEQFTEFMTPYYKTIVPELNRLHIVPFVDTDGDITIPAAWFQEVGIQGLLPLERMAGVDVVKLRHDHPTLRMIGAFDKTVMHLGEERIRREFERLLPVMRSGGYIPSVDHQTPPEVSLDDYRLYVRLLREYCERAADDTLNQ